MAPLQELLVNLFHAEYVKWPCPTLNLEVFTVSFKVKMLKQAANSIETAKLQECKTWTGPVNVARCLLWSILRTVMVKHIYRGIQYKTTPFPTVMPNGNKTSLYK